MTGKLSLVPATAGTPAELRAAARDFYRQAVADGAPPSGAELGRRFGMSERWGRDRVADVNTRLAGTAGPASPVLLTGNPQRNDTNPQPTGPGSYPAAADPTGELADRVPGGTSDRPPAASPTGGRAGRVPGGTAAASRLQVGAGGVRVVIRWVTTLAVIVVAACAARASYDHQRHVVELAGEEQAAWYLPLSVDGMMLVASLNMLVRRWDGLPAGRLTWCALILGGVASLAANVAAAEPTVIGRLVAAWPPVCLIVSYELLMQQLPTHPQRGERS